MHREALYRLPLICVLMGSIGTSARAGDSPAEAKLKEKGLTKAVSTWVIEDEKPVLASMKEARATFHNYAQVAERQAEAEDLAAQSKLLDEQRVVLQNNLTNLNQQIAQMPNPAAGMNSRYSRYYQQTPANNPLLAQRVQLNAEMAELNQTQKTVKSQIMPPKEKASLDAEVARRKDAFKTTLADLRKQVDVVTKKYADLAADETVKTSIDDLKKAAHASVKLGPSDAFTTVMKELDQAERKYLGKGTPASTSIKKKAKAKK
jgi:small-conductance mechanosensitive channel